MFPGKLPQRGGKVIVFVSPCKIGPGICSKDNGIVFLYKYEQAFFAVSSQGRCGVAV
jgi:hypothetical protein